MFIARLPRVGVLVTKFFVDVIAGAHDLRQRSKLTGIVTMKGKGSGTSFHMARRQLMLRGRPVVTRLTRTMGFVELSQSPGVQCSISTSGEDDLEHPDATPAPH